MDSLSGLKGLRHVALKVKDIQRSKAFYQELLGMKVVWQPDAHNVYLSSGTDNLALHEVMEGSPNVSAGEKLDHFGFIVESIDRVQEIERDFRTKGIKIVHPFKIHRDGSASFYFSDPDGIIIQMLFEPTLSHQEIR
jgi:catechol 2,3-dioxygenase-like lactoylglutathione lyase family enzyme